MSATIAGLLGLLLGAALALGAELAWGLSGRLRRLADRGDEPDDHERRREDALRALVGEEVERPVDGEVSTQDMITGVMELRETRVREVMVPRIDVVALPVDKSLGEALDAVIDAGHSRVPVFRESIDDVAGVLYAKDLLVVLRDGLEEVSIEALARDCFFVPESKTVNELLHELRQERVHLAVVVDEYGGTAGLVTIEDILEEIVGEIQDEYDSEEPDVLLVDVDAGEGVFRAGIDIHDVNRLLGVDLSTEDDVDTLGGLVFTHLGKVPDEGETVACEGADLEVLEVEGRRIARVRVTRRETETGGDAGSGSEGRGQTDGGDA